MNRPIFRPTLDPTLGEMFVLLAWLIFVVASMAAMILIPAFHLLFWPSLWIYDLATAETPRNSLDPDPDIQPDPFKVSVSLWDRELDG